jgi:hypothetical protein
MFETLITQKITSRASRHKVEKANLEHRVKQLEADAARCQGVEEELKQLRQHLASADKASPRGTQSAWGPSGLGVCMLRRQVSLFHPCAAKPTVPRAASTGEAAAAAEVGRRGPKKRT